jgi:hypothetical protein
LWTVFAWRVWVDGGGRGSTGIDCWAAGCPTTQLDAMKGAGPPFLVGCFPSAGFRSRDAVGRPSRTSTVRTRSFPPQTSTLCCSVSGRLVPSPAGVLVNTGQPPDRRSRGQTDGHGQDCLARTIDPGRVSAKIDNRSICNALVSADECAHGTRGLAAVEDVCIWWLLWIIMRWLVDGFLSGARFDRHSHDEFWR